MKEATRRIVIFAALFALANLLTAGIVVGLGVLHGYEIADFTEKLSADPGSLSGSVLRQLVWIQTVTIFILPAILFGLVCYKGRMFNYFKLDRAPRYLTIFLGIILLLTGYPLVSLSFNINSMIPLPEWATTMESNAADMLGTVLQMNSLGDFLTTLIIVAILPAIGEELVFRGVLQRQFGELMKNRVAGVWVAAIIFSMIHLQFEGFLPRVVLGAILGYLYLWTNNLWVPIIAHLFNNGVQVGLLYFADIDMQNLESPSGMEIGFWTTAISILLFILTSILIRNASKNAPS